MITYIGVAAIGHDQRELLLARQTDIDILGRTRSRQQPTVVQLRPVCPDLEHHTPIVSNLIIHSYTGQKRAACPAQGIADIRCRVSTQAFGIGLSIERNYSSIPGSLSACRAEG